MPSEIEVFRAALKTADPNTVRKLRLLALAGKIKSMDEADPTEPLVVVASANHCGIVGCLQARCDCGEPVWLSPSTQEMLKERGANPTRIICTACFTLEIENRREEPDAETRPQ